MEQKIIDTLRAYTTIIVETVYETSQTLGFCPEGPMYAALMGHMELEHFNKLIDACKANDLLRNGPRAHTLVVNEDKCRRHGLIRS